MKEFNTDKIGTFVYESCCEIAFVYPDDVRKSLVESAEKERNPMGRSILNLLVENEKIAQNKGIPMCQDTGMAVIFLRIGNELQLVGNPLNDVINAAVEVAYKDKYLRKSIVTDPLFDRKNTLTNTPAIIYTEFTQGDKIEIEVMAKGFGSENCSAVRMLKPSDGVEGVRRFIIETVTKAAPNACLPMVVGIGIGGTMDYSAYLAKKACLRPIGEWSSDIRYADFERELLQMINSMDFGPMGLGGDTSALHVAIEHFPTHIAALPVSINIICHMVRHKKGILV